MPKTSFSKKETFWNCNTPFQLGAPFPLGAPDLGQEASLQNLLSHLNRNVSDARFHIRQNIIWDQWLLQEKNKRSLWSQRRNKCGDDEYPHISGCAKKAEHLKAQLLRKLADMSERDNYLEGGGCFVIMNIDLGTATCGRSSCTEWSVSGHMCWGHAQRLKDQH